MMEAPVHAADAFEGKHVWHCSVAIKPEDGVRTDEEWAQVARAIVAEAGIAPAGDPNGCAWLAVRHGVSAGGNDHIHIVATLAHPDGTREQAMNDYYAVGRVASRFEQEWDITRTERRDGTAAVEPTRAEREKAQRRASAADDGPERAPGSPPGASDRGLVPARLWLREAAQNAAAGTSDFEGFKDALEADGVLVFPRMSTRHEGEVTGYSLALPGDVDAAGEPVRFSGGRLTADLTLPALQRRWASGEGWAGEIRLATREQMVATMRYCASTSSTPLEYLEQLRERGLFVRERHSQRSRATTGPGGSQDAVNGDVGTVVGGAAEVGEITGYAVALPPRRAGSSLRVAALFLAGASSAGEHVELAQLVINTLALVEAISALRLAQQRQAEAAAAGEAASHLRRDLERRSAAGITAGPAVTKRRGLSEAVTAGPKTHGMEVTRASFLGTPPVDEPAQGL
ncbi:relaxase/mobilization nuclease domain-containing protein [Nocardioides alkalitolerans]|uniref:relaxase/mobilization nuclease domain-containing protein n=1 Tax=Nocardioides alkalitolerans TaxID=281714 RepID=UPI003CCC057A